MFVKANALQKLTFLQMMGYGMSWASFASIELMSSARFGHKRIAYLAASQGFTQDTDVILLTTNLLKKELRGGVYEAGLAINCISNIVTEDLARDLLPELTSLTGHPQPYLRKKAILCLFKVFVKYPQGLRLTFAKIQQCLEDSNRDCNLSFELLRAKSSSSRHRLSSGMLYGEEAPFSVRCPYSRRISRFTKLSTMSLDLP